jgi:phosphate transport system protein
VTTQVNAVATDLLAVIELSQPAGNIQYRQISLFSMFNKDHTSPQFDAELNTLATNVLEMGYLAEIQFRLAISSLTSGSSTSAEQVEGDVPSIPHLKQIIDESCDLLLARRQPVAVDLRAIVAIIRIANDLERLHEHTQKILIAASKITADDRGRLPRYRELNHSAGIALDMLHNALDAFSNVDPIIAKKVEVMDEDINVEYRTMMRHLVTFMMEDSNMISSAIEILMIAKSIERIGDHAKNIAILVKYMVDGRQRD